MYQDAYNDVGDDEEDNADDDYDDDDDDDDDEDVDEDDENNNDDDVSSDRVKSLLGLLKKHNVYFRKFISRKSISRK